MMNFKLRIYGRPVSGAAALDVINPATEEGLAEAPRADLCSCSRRRDHARAARATGQIGRRTEGKKRRVRSVVSGATVKALSEAH